MSSLASAMVSNPALSSQVQRSDRDVKVKRIGPANRTVRSKATDEKRPAGDDKHASGA